MIITGMLAWWRESPETLTRVVESSACIIDRLVAVDGGYRLGPDATACSPTGEAVAILEAAQRVGIDCQLVVPSRVWDGQVQKRNEMLQLAVRGSDFVMPLDADWELSGDRDLIREELAASSNDAFRVVFHTPVPADDFDVAAYSAHAQHEKLAGLAVKRELLFRVLPEMEVGPRHWWYSGVRDGVRVGLWGCSGVYPRARSQRLAAPFQIDHLCFFRPLEEVERNRTFVQRTDSEIKLSGVEA